MRKLISSTNQSVRGKRTYLVSVGFIGVGIVGWMIGAIDGARAIELILEGAGFSGLRAAVR